MPKSPSHSMIALLIVILTLLPTAFTLSEETLSAKSQKDLEAMLVEIRTNTSQNNRFLGDGPLLALRKKLASLEVRKQPGTYVQTLVRLGVEEVDQGNIDNGIKRLTEAWQMMDQQVNVPDAIRAEISSSLGNAYLRLAESENCCALYSPESCIVPLQGKAIHTKRRGCEQAIKYFEEVIRLKEVDPFLRLKCVWLANLAYMALGEYPEKVPKDLLVPPSTFQSRVRFPKFDNVASELGIDLFNLAGGAVMDDFDGDYDLDLVTSCWDPAESMQFYQNQGNGKFKKTTEQAGLSRMLGGLNLVQADYDNDGDLDVYVLRGAWMGPYGGHPNSLLQNQGDGVFVDRTFESGLGDKHYPTQTAAWADYDNDGDLDLYVGNESLPGSFSAPCQLFQNQGDGTFKDVAAQAGVTNDFLTKGVVWGDIDGDRWPDLVVSNLEAKNRLYRNQGDGTFKDIAKEAGTEMPLKSFPAWIWDFDNDGQLDVFISSYGSKTANFVLHYLGQPSQIEHPGHYRGNGKGQFTNVSQKQGLAQPMMPMGCNIGDLNNDGYLDFYLGTGEPNVTVILPNMMFLNNGGRQFIDVTMNGGFGHLQKGHAVVFADYDNDGDQDIFEQMGGAKPVDEYRDALFANPGFGNHWLKVKLVGVKSNRCGIGARIHAEFVDRGRKRSVYRHIGSGGSFGANPLVEHIGVGKATRITRLEIYWPTSDIRQELGNVPVNKFLEITEGVAKPKVID